MTILGRMEDTPEEAAFRAEVRAYLDARLRPRTPTQAVQVMGAGGEDLDGGRRFLAVLAERGWATPTWPAEFGGIAASPALAALIAQEVARFEAPDLYPFMVGISLVGPTLLSHGTVEQRSRWLPLIASGSEIWCQLFSEPDAGSDLASLRTRADGDGDTWRIAGQKVWSSRAHYSRWGLLLARHDPALPKHAGITAFAVDMRAPGVQVRPLRQLNGDAHFSEVFLNDVPVPDTDRIGEVGEGWAVARTTLLHERGAIAGGGAGLSPDHLVRLLQASARDGDAVARERTADAVGRLHLNRLTALRARAAAREGRQPGPEGSGAKIRWSETIKAAAGLALDLQGPAGVVDLGDWQTLFLTSPSLSIRGGTDEIQRNIVAERVLGLPRDPG